MSQSGRPTLFHVGAFAWREIIDKATAFFGNIHQAIRAELFQPVAEQIRYADLAHELTNLPGSNSNSRPRAGSRSGSRTSSSSSPRFDYRSSPRFDYRSYSGLGAHRCSD